MVSNTGIFVHSVAAGWLMTQLTSSPLMVALVQAATALPVFLLGLPAGALSDIVDRRRYLLGVQLWMAAISVLLAVLTIFQVMGAWTLLALTFAVGAGTAMMLPTWAATVPSLVPRDELPQSTALNSVGMNGARAIGPAIGGFVIVLAGPGSAFLTAAIGFCAVLAALFYWRYTQERSALPSERFVSAMRAGLRFAAQSPRVKAALVRSASFVFFAAAPWALLPLLVRERLQAGGHVYGILLALIGVGALIGAFILPYVRARWSSNSLVRGATGLFALTGALFAWGTNAYIVGVAALVFGGIWISVVSSLQLAAQTYAPAWVKARTLAVFSVVFQGSLALGSVAWGWLAVHAGLPVALTVATAGAVVAAVITRSYRIVPSDPKSVTPSRHVPPPAVAPEYSELVTSGRAPVMVTVQYQVQREHVADFRKVMEVVARSRRRSGASKWGLFEDVEHPGKWVEFFLCESWLEHLRQAERTTETDRLREEKIRGYLIEGTAPKIRRCLAHQPSPDTQH